MRLGGFVIHGSDVATLPACLESLGAVADEVVAVDSGDGPGAPGVRTLKVPWQGYGAARAAAVQALEGCDWVLYLDADERLEAPARERLRAWKAKGGSAAPAHLLPVHDWAELPTGRFLYRTHHRARLVRRALAAWRPEMIVHEALARPDAVRLDAPIEHRFATDVPQRGQKEETYALLWALRAHAEGRRGKPVALQRPAIFVRDALFKGAAFRGGLAGVKLAWAVAGYHARKYERLEELRAGAHPELVQAFAQGHYGRVFELAADSRASAGGPGR